jgi:hypothetical protein
VAKEPAEGEGKPSDQSWFWTESWQQGERAVDADIAAGRVSRSENAEEFLRSLDRIRGLKPKTGE